MPNIDDYVQQIEQATYGREVRNAIARGIELCYSDQHSIRYDTPQALQETQRAQARENANAAARADLALPYSRTHDYQQYEYTLWEDGFVYRFTQDKPASHTPTGGNPGDWDETYVEKAQLGNDIFAINTGVWTAINTANGNIQQNASDISNLTNKVGAVPGGTTVENQINNLGIAVSDNTTDIDVIQRTIGSGLDPNNTVKSQLDDIKDDIGTVPSGFTVEDQITDLKNSIGTVPQGETVESQISDVMGEVMNNRGYINGLSDKVGTVPQGETVESQITDLKSAIDVLEPAATSEDVGKTLVVKTVANGKVSAYEFGLTGEGLTSSVKIALLDCFAHVAWIDENGKDYYDALYDALFSIPVAIAANFSQGSAIIYNTDTLDSLRQYLTVVAQYEDGTSKVVTNYALFGTLTPGTSQITASYGGKTDVFNVTVTQNLSYITAVYTQGASIVYTDDSLDSLKQYLVVTYYAQPGDTGIILQDSQYVLSGTLNEGANTIVATYNSLSTTFTVNAVRWGFVLNESFVSTGSNSLDTGVLLTEGDFTIATEFVVDSFPDTSVGFIWSNYTTDHVYVALQHARKGDGTTNIWGVGIRNGTMSNVFQAGQTVRIVNIISNYSSSGYTASVTLKNLATGNTESTSLSYDVDTITGDNIFLGKKATVRGLVGTISKCIIDRGQWTNAQITSFLEGS